MSYKFDFQWKSVWLSTIEIVIVESKDLFKYDDNIDKVKVVRFGIWLNESHCKLGVKGSVSFGYENLGILSFNYTDEDKMLDALINDGVDVSDIEDCWCSS